MKTRKMTFSRGQSYANSWWENLSFRCRYQGFLFQLSNRLLSISSIKRPVSKINYVDKITLSGKVIDADSKENLIGASIVITGNHYYLSGTSTGLEGNFQLIVDRERMTQDGFIEISYTGYSTKRLAIETLKNSPTITLQASVELNEWLRDQ